MRYGLRPLIDTAALDAAAEAAAEAAADGMVCVAGSIGGRKAAPSLGSVLSRGFRIPLPMLSIIIKVPPAQPTMKYLSGLVVLRGRGGGSRTMSGRSGSVQKAGGGWREKYEGGLKMGAKG